MVREVKTGGVWNPDGIPELTARQLGGLFALPETGRVSVLVPEFGDASEVNWFLQGMTRPEDWERVTVFGLDESRIHVQDHGGTMDYAIVGDLIAKGGRISNNCFGLCFCRPPARELGRNSRTETAYLEPVARRLKAGGALCFIAREEISLREDFRKAFSRYFIVEAVSRLPEERHRQVAIIASRKQKFFVSEGEMAEMGQMLRSAEELPEGDAAMNIVTVPVSDPDDVQEFSGSYDAKEAAKALAQAGFPELFREMLFPERNAEAELQRSPQPPDEGKLIMLGITNQVPGRIGKPGRNVILKRGSGGRVTTSVFDERNGSTVIVDTTRNEAAVNILLPEGLARTLQ